MGLDTTHGCWHGGYGSFRIWRECVARAADVPLNAMEGFYEPPAEEAVEWLRPREGGPLCQSYLGPCLSGWVDRVTPWLPLPWEALRPDPIHILLNHSDCDGDIAPEDCLPLAARLRELLPLIEGEPAYGKWTTEWARQCAENFAEGLEAAAAAGEPVEFH